jgi:hypothetical protein
MQPRHFSLRFFLFGGLLSLLICVLTLAAPTALALSGKIREFAVPTANSGPLDITAGPDGNLWFTETSGNNIGRITPAPKHKLTEFPTPTASPKASRRGPIATSGSPRAVTVATRSGASAPLPRTNSASLRSRRRMTTPKAHELRNEIVEELISAQVSKSGANLDVEIVRGNRSSSMGNEKGRKEVERRQSEEKGNGGTARN